MIKSILIAYAFFVGLSAVLYLPKLIQFCYAFKKPPYKQATEKRRISLIIPARNESKIIGALFDSILKQDYDKEFFDINVIVKEENDPTIELAKAIGANVFVVPEQTCKGAALDGYFKALTEEQFESYDAFVIIDADAILEPNYVAELNNALEHDYQIYLSRKRIKNYLGDRKSRTIFSNCSALTYPFLDDLGNTYRTKKGIPLNMCGQGMMIRKDVIREINGWPYRTLTEDYELRMDCILKGFTSMYYPYAIIYTEEVLRHKDSYNRRLRWLTGYSQCDKMYKKKVKKQIREKGSINAGEFEYLFALYPVILFIVATILTACGGAGLSIYYAYHHNPLWTKALVLLVGMPFGVMYGLVFLYCLLAMLTYWDVFSKLTVWERISTLFFAPIYTLEYFPIFIQSRIYARTSYGWEQTARVEYAKEAREEKAQKRKNKRKK